MALCVTSPAFLISAVVQQTLMSAMFIFVSAGAGGCDKALTLRKSVVSPRRQMSPKIDWWGRLKKESGCLH